MLGLVLFKAGGDGIEGTFHALRKLVVTHFLHIVHVHYLYVEQAYEGKRHYYGQKPYGRLFHFLIYRLSFPARGNTVCFRVNLTMLTIAMYNCCENYKTSCNL